jgi:hypothetical protein
VLFVVLVDNIYQCAKIADENNMNLRHLPKSEHAAHSMQKLAAGSNDLVQSAFSILD